MTLATGTKLGRYEIRSKIGAGGMGEVYLAQDTKLDRKAALKILPAEVASNQDWMRRFVQEAKAASALNHPNIITIHEIDETDSGHFIATEFIDGETLRERVLNAPLKLGESLDIATQIASALAAAHAAGIVHRDIKPENIMIRHDGIVKVLDFGLAKLTARLPTDSVDTEAATKALVQTEPGVVMGTVEYMSPEQARGLAVDVRTDIFSLGVVIYEMVAGQAPFGGATRSDLIVALLEREPPPLARFTPESPAELERIVMKALAKNPDERFQTAKDLLIDLKRLKQKLDVEAEIERTSAPELRSGGGAAKPSLAPEIVSTAPRATAQTAFEGSPATSSAEYVIFGIKQHKLAAAIALLVLVTGAVGLSLYLHARNSEVAIESIAVLPFANQNHDPDSEYLSDGLTESIINSLTQLPNLRVIARSSVFRYQGKETDPMAAGKELGVRAVLTGRILQRGDNLTISTELLDVRDNKQLWGEQYNEKVSDLLAVQREIAKEITSNLRLQLSGPDQKRLARHYTENPEAYQLYLRGRYFWNKFTEDGVRKSIEYFNQAIEKDPNYAQAYAGLAAAYNVLGNNYQNPNETAIKSKAAAAKALELDETLAEGHEALAAIKLFYDWDWPGVERELKRALELNPNFANTHLLYCYYFRDMGRLDEAIVEAKRAIELDPLSQHAITTLGRTYVYARQYDQAIAQCRKAVELDPTSLPGAHAWLVVAYALTDRYPDAITEANNMVALFGRDQRTLALLAWVYARSGQQGEARKLLAELNERAKHSYVSLSGLATIYLGLGEKDEAFTLLNKAYEERSSDMIDLRVDPQLDPLRSDPRFAELLQRVGLAR
jgi:serine/threonine protein kinase/Tfp pilus assembly protein PilF